MGRSALTSDQIKVHGLKDGLTPGCEVYTKCFGDGPFVLIQRADEMMVDSLIPIRGEKNSYSQTRFVLEDTWIVRGKGGGYQQLPRAVLTVRKPIRWYMRPAFLSVTASVISAGTVSALFLLFFG